jgi:hypothetical protein
MRGLAPMGGWEDAGAVYFKGGFGVKEVYGSRKHKGQGSIRVKEA